MKTNRTREYAERFLNASVRHELDERTSKVYSVDGGSYSLTLTLCVFMKIVALGIFSYCFSFFFAAARECVVSSSDCESMMMMIVVYASVFVDSAG